MAKIWTAQERKPQMPGFAEGLAIQSKAAVRLSDSCHGGHCLRQAAWRSREGAEDALSHKFTPDTRQDTRDVPSGISEGQNDPTSTSRAHVHPQCLCRHGLAAEDEKKSCTPHALPSLPRCLGEHQGCCLLSQISMATVRAQIS